MLAGGCATKKYVRNTTAPVQAKVDQVGEQTATNSKQINDTRNDLKAVDEKAQSGISAAQEKAATADQHAGDAMNKANAADQHAALNSATDASGLASADGQYPDWIDHAVPPRLDFFRYANGGWVDKNPIPARFPSWEPSRILSESNARL